MGFRPCLGINVVRKFQELNMVARNSAPDVTNLLIFKEFYVSVAHYLTAFYRKRKQIKHDYVCVGFPLVYGCIRSINTNKRTLFKM